MIITLKKIKLLTKNLLNSYFKSIKWNKLANLFVKKYNYKKVSQNWSHIKLRYSTNAVLIIPAHSELKLGTFNNILRTVSSHTWISQNNIFENIF
jgi:predicted RNA binding protein YcfA (HicA-like mRNA interferase family)